MEIALEKIELVRDRTGVSYKEAKDALEAADGSVVDAIIAIEENLDSGVTKSTAAKKDELVGKAKEIIAKGNVSRVRVTRDGETLMNIPLVAGVVGAVLAPWGLIAGTVAALGFKCKIEFIKDDGSVVDISEKANDAYDKAKTKGSDVFFDVKERGTGIYADLKEKAPTSLDELKEKATDAFNEIKEKTPDSFEEWKAKGEEVLNKAKDVAEKTADRFRKEADELEAELEESKEDVFDEIKKMSGEINRESDSITQSLRSELEEMQREAAQGIKNFEEELKDE